MPFSYRASTSQGNSSSNAVNVAKPAGLSDNDLIVVTAYLETDANTWSSVAAGFTQAASVKAASDGSHSSFSIRTWYKWASGELGGACWLWTPTSTNWRVVVCSAYSGGAGSGSAIDVTSACFGIVANESLQTAPTVTTSSANDLLTWGYGNSAGNDPTAASGAASSLRVALGGATISDGNIVAAGATGTTRPNGGVGGTSYGALHAAYFLSPGGGGGAAIAPIGYLRPWGIFG